MIEIWTDGGCTPNPGRGGWGVVIKDGETITKFHGGNQRTTNNRMEFQAVIEALKRVEPGSEAVVYSDSTLVVNILSGTWRGKRNRDLIEEARNLIRGRKITFRWVRGHNGNRFNEEADALATRAIPSRRQSDSVRRRKPKAREIYQDHSDPWREPSLAVLMGERIE